MTKKVSKPIVFKKDIKSLAPVIKSLSLVKIDGFYQVLEISTQGNAVVSVRPLEEANVKAIALETLKIQTVKYFFGDID